MRQIKLEMVEELSARYEIDVNLFVELGKNFTMDPNIHHNAHGFTGILFLLANTHSWQKEGHLQGMPHPVYLHGNICSAHQTFAPWKRMADGHLNLLS